MPGPLTPRERAALKEADKAGGLIRGRSGFYPGFLAQGTPLLPATVSGLVQRKLLARPDPLSPRRVITDAGRQALTSLDFQPAPAATPRAYVD